MANGLKWFLCLGLTCGVGSVVLADTGLTLSVSPGYAQGSFGTDSITHISYVPVSLRYTGESASLKLNLSYLSVRGRGVLVSGGGVSGSAGGDGTRSGFGDVWLEWAYRWKAEGAGPDLLPYAKIKFGTASHEEGLGTGENDYEGGMTIEWAPSPEIFPYISLGYRVIGEPLNVRTRNIPLYEAGATFKRDDKHYITLIVSGNPSADPGLAGSADVLVAWNYVLNARVGFQSYLDLGLQDGSPDFSVGLGFDQRF